MAWVMIFWIYTTSLPLPDGITSGRIGYFLSQQACEKEGQRFKGDKTDRNYFCTEVEVKE